MQNEFKKNCRKYSADESLEEFIQRNSKIAFWCRYIKECCTFYSTTMRDNDVFYTGLKTKLLFNSLKQYFECPLSTTTDINVAHRFSGGTDGIILELRQADFKTRYFDVSFLSEFPQECERLIMGTSLTIYDIKTNSSSRQHYISALRMLEQIITGQFIEYDKRGERALNAVLRYCMTLNLNHNNSMTVTDSLCKYIDKENAEILMTYLLQEQYDTDSVMDELTREVQDSFKNCMNNPPCIKKMKEFFRIKEQTYVVDMFQNLIENMIQLYRVNMLWINKYQLNKIKCAALKQLIATDELFFKHYGIDMLNVKLVHQFTWMIGGNEYQEFKSMKVRKYIKSKTYEIVMDDNESISFHLECCARYSGAFDNCALFLHLDSLPANIESITIEYDIICKYNSQFIHHQMTPQILRRTGSENSCGSQIFPSHILMKTNELQWFVAIKMIYKS
eukprot:335280_1